MCMELLQIFRLAYLAFKDIKRNIAINNPLIFVTIIKINLQHLEKCLNNDHAWSLFYFL